MPVITPPERTRRLPFLLAIIASMAGLALWYGDWLDAYGAVTVAADVYFLSYLADLLRLLPQLTSEYLKKHAASSDVPKWVIFSISLVAVAAAMVSLFSTINTQPRPAPLLIAALLSVPLGWFTVHLVAAIHYAHLFWQPDATDDKPRRGLEFPGTKAPAGWDFVYFALVIGMTAQTSDVQITGAHMRAFNLVHAIVSFFFNTVLIAAAVSFAVSLGNQAV